MSEEYYDSEIAPELVRVAQLCAAKGMPFVCAVEYEPGGIAETTKLVDGYSFAIAMVSIAIRATGNVDKFMFNCYRWLKKWNAGHNSVFLDMIDKGRIE